MLCPKCKKGKLKLIEEVSGSFVYEVEDNGEIDYFNKDYCGDSWVALECDSCKVEFDYDINSDDKIILIEEVAQ